jgi:peptidyl-dipeptidase A
MREAQRLNAGLIAGMAAVLMLISILNACQNKSSKASPTVAEAEKFIADTEKLLADLSLKASRAAWVQSNFIVVCG